MLAEHNLERSSWITDQGIRIGALYPLEPDQGGVILHARSIYGFQEPDLAGTDAGIRLHHWRRITHYHDHIQQHVAQNQKDH